MTSPKISAIDKTMTLIFRAFISALLIVVFSDLQRARLQIERNTELLRNFADRLADLEDHVHHK